jgi:hypothetical protein
MPTGSDPVWFTWVCFDGDKESNSTVITVSFHIPKNQANFTWLLPGASERNLLQWTEKRASVLLLPEMHTTPTYLPSEETYPGHYNSKSLKQVNRPEK